jgi:hypothetical protein
VRVGLWIPKSNATSSESILNIIESGYVDTQLGYRVGHGRDTNVSRFMDT